MIVVDQPDRRALLARQCDHAHLCGQLAARWDRPDSVTPSVWSHFQVAARRHDDGWASVDEDPALDPLGRPIDFKTVHTSQHVEIWRKSIAQTMVDDKFAALLVAMHARYLYTTVAHDHAEDPALAAEFVDQLDQSITGAIDMCRHSGMSHAVERPQLYLLQSLLSFIDGLSLAMIGAVDWGFCRGPIAYGTHKAPVSITRVDGSLRVSPWPFDPNVEAFEVAMPVQVLPRGHFASEAIFRQVLADTPSESYRCVFERN